MAARKLRGLLVDLDGTVRQTKSGRPHPVKSWDQVIRPGVEARLRAFKERKYKIVGVTNQGGVAYGYLTEIDVEKIHEHLQEELLPGIFDLIFYCPYHPKGRVPQYRLDSNDRKPNPGMAFKARDALGLDLAKSIMVGDMESDREFAANAGIPHYFHPDRFFGLNPDPNVLELLQQATREVAAKKKAGTAKKPKRAPKKPSPAKKKVRRAGAKPKPGAKRRAGSARRANAKRR